MNKKHPLAVSTEVQAEWNHVFTEWPLIWSQQCRATGYTFKSCEEVLGAEYCYYCVTQLKNFSDEGIGDIKIWVPKVKNALGQRNNSFLFVISSVICQLIMKNAVQWPKELNLKHFFHLQSLSQRLFVIATWRAGFKDHI